MTTCTRWGPGSMVRGCIREPCTGQHRDAGRDLRATTGAAGHTGRAAAAQRRNRAARRRAAPGAPDRPRDLGQRRRLWQLPGAGARGNAGHPGIAVDRHLLPAAARPLRRPGRGSLPVRADRGDRGHSGLGGRVRGPNLDQIVVGLKDSGAQVLLAGMTLPPNYGPDYIASFQRVYSDLAAKDKVALIPFLLEGVAGTSRMQRDGLHPTADGNRLVAATVMRYLQPLLRGRHSGAGG